MTTSGSSVENINRKIAILKHEIIQCGKLGLLNINKHCEQFVGDLLYLIYDKKLSNLNENAVNFPGLDLGLTNDIAYQITSQVDVQKVEDTLNKVVKYHHHLKFPKIRIFMLSDKQTSYRSLKIPTATGFTFDPQSEIIDFNDLLKMVATLPSDKVSLINEFVERELPYTIDRLQEKEKQEESKRNTFIDIKNGLVKSNLQFYFHWSVNLVLHGANLSAPVLYHKLNKILDTWQKRAYLDIFDKKFLQNPGSREIRYVKPLADKGFINHFGQSILSLQPNNIKLEIAEYYSQKLMLSNLNDSVAGLLTLLMAIKQMNPDPAFRAEVDVVMDTNADYTFHNTNSVYSIEYVMNTFKLDAGIVEISKLMRSFSNEEYIELMADILNIFVSNRDFYNPGDPFMNIDFNNQNIALDHLRNRIGPTLNEL